MKRALLASLLVLGSLTFVSVPAQAHDQPGVRCAWATRGPVGRTFRLRVFNHTSTDGYVVCIMKTYGGGAGREFHAYYEWVNDHSAEYARFVTPGGNWEWINIAHSHGPWQGD